MIYNWFPPVVLGLVTLRSSGGLDAPVNLLRALVDADCKSQEVVARSLSNLVSDLRRGFVRATQIDAGDSQDLLCSPSVGMSSLRRCLPRAVADTHSLYCQGFSAICPVMTSSTLPVPKPSSPGLGSALSG